MKKQIFRIVLGVGMAGTIGSLALLNAHAAAPTSKQKRSSTSRKNVIAKRLQANVNENVKAPKNLGLMDRGRKSNPNISPAGVPLIVAGGGPAATSNSATFFTTGTGSIYVGNFMQAPRNFPSSWFPFSVTGVFGYWTPDGLGAGLTPNKQVAAGVAAAPFATATGMGSWLSYESVIYSFAGAGGAAAGIVGGPANLAPQAVVSPNGVAAGLLLRGPGAAVGGNGLGGQTPNPDPANEQYIFAAPPRYVSSLLALSPGFNQAAWITGAYVSGATVPVELQKFSAN